MTFQRCRGSSQRSPHMPPMRSFRAPARVARSRLPGARVGRAGARRVRPPSIARPVVAVNAPSNPRPRSAKAAGPHPRPSHALWCSVPTPHRLTGSFARLNSTGNPHSARHWPQRSPQSSSASSHTCPRGTRGTGWSRYRSPRNGSPSVAITSRFSSPGRLHGRSGCPSIAGRYAGNEPALPNPGCRQGPEPAMLPRPLSPRGPTTNQCSWSTMS